MKKSKETREIPSNVEDETYPNARNIIQISWTINMNGLNSPVKDKHS